MCPSVVSRFALFPETPTGSELTAIVPASGQCVPNAVEVEQPRLLCKGDGNWTLPSGGCKCLPGYEPVGQSCKGKLDILISIPCFFCDHTHLRIRFSPPTHDHHRHPCKLVLTISPHFSFHWLNGMFLQYVHLLHSSQWQGMNYVVRALLIAELLIVDRLSADVIMAITGRRRIQSGLHAHVRQSPLSPLFSFFYFLFLLPSSNCFFSSSFH